MLLKKINLMSKSKTRAKFEKKGFFFLARKKPDSFSKNRVNFVKEIDSNHTSPFIGE